LTQASSRRLQKKQYPKRLIDKPGLSRLIFRQMTENEICFFSFSEMNRTFFYKTIIGTLPIYNILILSMII
jgi:hypothetical protein